MTKGCLMRLIDRYEVMAMLVAAVESGSLSAAARKLRVPLPTVSRKISELEAQLGTRLVIRTTRQLTPTDAGTAYVAASRRILEEVDDAERAATGEYVAPKGDLILTAPLVIGRLYVLPVVVDFLAQYPEIKIRLVLSDRQLRLIDDHVDMAVRGGAPSDISMAATPLGAMRWVVCGSPAYLAAHGRPERPPDLSALPCVTYDLFTPATSWIFRHPDTNSEMTVPINPRLSVSTADAAVDAAVGGLGLTRVLLSEAAPAIEEDTLRIVLATFEPQPLPYNLVHPERALLPLKMRSFLDFAAPRLRAAFSAFQKSN
jgi:DNA-binding transcriptional LysR family regulator